MKPAICDQTLDVRGLEPPEPLARVLEALSTLPDDRHLVMVIDREPHLLYGILARNGYQYSVETDNAVRYDISIWREP